jgi:hypothetical protein
VTRDWCVRFVEWLLDAQIGEGVFAEDRLGVHVRRHKSALPRERLLRRETLHVGALYQMLQILGEICQRGVDGYFVFPLELGPHLSELGVGAGRRYYVVHDVDVDVVQDHHVAVGGGAGHVVHDVPEDDTVLGGRDLDVSLNVAEIFRGQHHRLGLLDQFQVAQSRQLESAILQSVVGLVDDQHVQHYVVLVDVHVRLGVHRVGETRQLCHFVQFVYVAASLAATGAAPDQSLRQRRLEHVFSKFPGFVRLQLQETDRIVGLDHVALFLFGLLVERFFQFLRHQHVVERLAAQLREDFYNRGAAIRQDPQAEQDVVFVVIRDGFSWQTCKSTPTFFSRAYFYPMLFSKPPQKTNTLVEKHPRFDAK